MQNTLVYGLLLAFILVFVVFPFAVMVRELCSSKHRMVDKMNRWRR